MEKVIFLGPLGTTFSHMAYNALEAAFSAPLVSEKNYIPPASNADVVALMKENSFHGRRAYAALAMGTSTKGRIVQSLEPFIGLLGTYGNTESCPFHIVGGVKYEVNFFCMVQKGLSVESVTKVVAHQEALFTCKDWIAQTFPGRISEAVSSNGEAARRVAQVAGYETSVALGPQCAAAAYDLDILTDSCQDTPDARTTFFLLAPHTHVAAVGEDNRALVVFEVSHRSSALAKALLVFGEQGLSLIQIHSIPIDSQNYHFVIELDVRKGEIEAFAKAMRSFCRCVKSHIVFGPFQIIDR